MCVCHPPPDVSLQGGGCVPIYFLCTVCYTDVPGLERWGFLLFFRANDKKWFALYAFFLGLLSCMSVSRRTKYKERVWNRRRREYSHGWLPGIMP